MIMKLVGRKTFWRDRLSIPAGFALFGVACAIYIGVDAGAGWLLGGPVGIGTLLFALLIGPSVRWSLKLLHVEPQRVGGPDSD